MDKMNMENHHIYEIGFFLNLFNLLNNFTS